MNFSFGKLDISLAPWRELIFIANPSSCQHPSTLSIRSTYSDLFQLNRACSLISRDLLSMLSIFVVSPVLYIALVLGHVVKLKGWTVHEYLFLRTLITLSYDSTYMNQRTLHHVHLTRASSSISRNLLSILLVTDYLCWSVACIPDYFHSFSIFY